MAAIVGPPPSPELIAYSNAHNLIAEAASVFSVAALTMVLRCYVRVFMLKTFGMDDWTMLLATLMSAVTMGLYVAEVPLGLGKHLSVIQLDPVKYQELNRIRYVHQIICGPAVTVVKISVAFFLLRFATKKRYRRFLYGLIIFLLAFLLACAGTLIWACIPVAASWNYALRPPPLGKGNAKCFTRDTFGQIALFNAVVNCFTDFLLALLPIPLIISLRLSLRTRISLILILSLGIFAGVASIIRAMVFNSILKDPRRFIHDKYSMWNYVELNVGIIAGSLPALKPLFVRFLREVKERTNASGSTSKTAGYDGSRAYHKHGSGRSGCGLELGEMKSKRGRSGETGHWNERGGNESDESIYPLQKDVNKMEMLNGKKGSIIVTTEYGVNHM